MTSRALCIMVLVVKRFFKWRLEVAKQEDLLAVFRAATTIRKNIKGSFHFIISQVTKI